VKKKIIRKFSHIQHFYQMNESNESSINNNKRKFIESFFGLISEMKFSIEFFHKVKVVDNQRNNTTCVFSLTQVFILFYFIYFFRHSLTSLRVKNCLLQNADFFIYFFYERSMPNCKRNEKLKIKWRRVVDATILLLCSNEFKIDLKIESKKIYCENENRMKNM
jgi:hypothetical protein